MSLRARRTLRAALAAALFIVPARAMAADAPATLFCSLLTSLPDGRIAVIAGGADATEGVSAKVQVFDDDTRSFGTIGELAHTRWYPGGTLTRTGTPVVAAGTSPGIEHFDLASGTSRELDTTLPANWYPTSSVPRRGSSSSRTSATSRSPTATPARAGTRSRGPRSPRSPTGPCCAPARAASGP